MNETTIPECLCVVSPASPGNGKFVTAKDWAALVEAFATAQYKGWSTVQPKLEQTRVAADHDGLIDRAGDQISTIILDVVEAARANP